MMAAMDTNQIDSLPFTLCVYCGSRPGQDPAHLELAREVGRWIGQNGARLVYGGGHHGLMGAVADAALAAGAHVTGVIPQALVEMEAAHQGCSELHVVATMHERKHLMAERADAILALPGGIGTFEELFEVWAWRQLGYHGKPIGLLNAGGYYDGLLAFLGTTVREGFVGNWQMELLQVGNTAADLLPRLAAAARPGIPASLDQI
jgi:uncharacterized protein (TIGR00730 family)